MTDLFPMIYKPRKKTAVTTKKIVKKKRVVKKEMALHIEVEGATYIVETLGGKFISESRIPNNVVGLLIRNAIEKAITNMAGDLETRQKDFDKAVKDLESLVKDEDKFVSRADSTVYVRTTKDYGQKPKLVNGVWEKDCAPVKKTAKKKGKKANVRA